MKDTNYYTTYGWMYNRLKLDTTSAAVYAIIYGFTKGEGNSEEKECSCSLKYFAESINRTKQTIVNILKKMIANGLIILRQKRADDGGLRNYYRANMKKLKELGIEETESHRRIKAEKPKNFTPSDKKFELPQSKNQNEGSQIFRPDSNTSCNTCSDSTVRTHEPTEKFGEYKNVRLSVSNFNELKKRFGEQFETSLRNFSCFIASNPFAYKKRKISHFEALSEWCEKDQSRACRQTSYRRKEYAPALPVDDKTKETSNKLLEKLRRFSCEGRVS